MTKDKQKEKPTLAEYLARALYECKVPLEAVNELAAAVAGKSEYRITTSLEARRKFAQEVEAAYILIENDEEGGVLAY